MTDAGDPHSSAVPMDQTDTLLADLLARPATEWSRGLDALCAEQAALAPELRRRFAILARMGITDAVEPGPIGDEAFPETFGPYRLVQRLGGGGMGVVYLARHRDLGRNVALKLIRPERLYFADARERFRREVEAVARLEHPGCVQIHQVGEAEGVPYFAMEHVAGVSLDQVIATLAQRPLGKLTGGDLADCLRQRAARAVETGTSELFSGPWARVCLRLVLAAAEALAHAHARGVVHRDIKPSNLMVTPEGRVVVIDFGLAVAEGTDRMTRSGAFLGSLPYMAPEQVRGEQAAIDPRTDVYSLGVCLYELLTLASPFESPSAETTRANILAGKAVPVRRRNSTVGADVALLCSVAMDVDPRRRYQHMTDFAADLAAILEHRAIAARPAGVWRAAVRWSRRHPVAATATLLTTLAVVGGPLIVSLAIAAQRDRAVEAERLAQRREYGANLAAANAALLAGNGPEARRRLDACPTAARGFEWRHLDLALHGSLLTLRAHRAEVTAVAIARDGTRVASGSNAGEIAVFDATTGTRLHTLQAGEQPIGQLEFDAATSELFSVAGGQVRVFSVATGALLRERVPAASRDAPFVHPAATGITCDHGGGRLSVLDATTFAAQREVRLDPTTDLPMGFALTDGTRLVAPLAIGGVAVWDTATGACLAQLLIPHEVTSLCVQPGLHRLASADATGHLSWAEPTPGATTQALHTGGRVVRDVALTRDGSHLVAGCETGEVLVFALRGGRLERTLYGHAGPAQALAIGTEADLLVTGGEDGTVRLWSPYLAPDSLNLRTESGASLAVGPDGSLVVGTQDAVVRRIDPDTGLVLWQTGHSHWINSLALADASRAVVASFHAMVRVLDFATGSTLRDIAFPEVAGHCHHMVADATGRRVFVAGRGGHVVAIDVLAGRVLGNVQAHEGEIYGLVLDAATDTLLSCGRDGRIVETPTDLTSTRALVTTKAPISTLLLDDDTLLTSERRALVRRDRRTGAILQQQPCPNYFITMATLGADRLVTGSQDGRVGFWDRRELELVVEFRQPALGIWKIAVSPDNDWLAINCDRGSARILYARPQATGDVPATLTKDLARVRAAAGRELAARTLERLVWSPAAHRAIEARGDLSPEFKAIALAALPSGGLYYLATHAMRLGTSVASAALVRDDLVVCRDTLSTFGRARNTDVHGPFATVALSLVHVRLGEFQDAIRTLRDPDLALPPELRSVACFVQTVAHRALGDTRAADLARAEFDALASGQLATDPLTQRLLEELLAKGN